MYPKYQIRKGCSKEMIKVVAYCRVSTDHDDQLNSLESQKSYFISFISKNIKWEFIKIYADEGITGTNTKKRKAFNQMIEDAKQNKFDLILTKEVSRFARNTLDSIFYTRQLMALGVGVIFTNDNIDTREPDSEFKLTLMASMAQEESRKTSSRVRWGLARTMEKGFALGNRIYGYYLSNGKLTVNEEEAKVVRLIYDLYLSGMGANGITKELEKRAILSPAGLESWKNVSIMRMLSNEKYMGTLKQRKEITIDFLEHKKIYNDGREPFIIKENNHEPIVSIDVFNAVQAEIQKRKKLQDDGKKYSHRYAFSSHIVCAQCGAAFRRKYWNGKHDKKNTVWQCANNVRYGTKKPSPYDATKTIGCDNKGVHETVLQGAFLDSLAVIRENSQSIRLDLLHNLKMSLEQTEDISGEIEKVKKEIQKVKHRKIKIIELFSDNAITREDFDNSNTIYTGKINALTKTLLDLKNQNSKRESIQEKIHSIEKIILPIVDCNEFTDGVCSSVLDKIVIHSRNKFSFFLTIYNNPDFFIPLSEQSQGRQARPDRLGQSEQQGLPERPASGRPDQPDLPERPGPEARRDRQAQASQVRPDPWGQPDRPEKTALSGPLGQLVRMEKLGQLDRQAPTGPPGRPEQLGRRGPRGRPDRPDQRGRLVQREQREQSERSGPQAQQAQRERLKSLAQCQHLIFQQAPFQ